MGLQLPLLAVSPEGLSDWSFPHGRSILVITFFFSPLPLSAGCKRSKAPFLRDCSRKRTRPFFALAILMLSGIFPFFLFFFFGSLVLSTSLHGCGDGASRDSGVFVVRRAPSPSSIVKAVIFPLPKGSVAASQLFAPNETSSGGGFFF